MIVSDTVFQISDEEFRLVADFVYQQFGIHFPAVKKGLIESRLAGVIRKRGLQSVADYLNAVKNDPSGFLLQEMMNKLTTNHSYFFREPMLLDFFTREGFARLGVPPKSPFPLTIWSAGCSEGQEPYSLAMLINDYCQGRPPVRLPCILATDISERALDRAAAGLYSQKEIDESVNPVYKIRYFEKADDHYRIKDEIKSFILFKKLNLNADRYPFKSKFDIIFCRNVMIYFDNESKRKIIANFARYLKPNGFLVIGSAESLSNLSTQFNRVSNSIYQKGTDHD